MARKLPVPSLGQAVQAATLLSIVANINWKGLKPMLDKLIGLFSGISLPKYWGRMLLIGVAATLIGFVLVDWRHQAVSAVENRAALAVAIGERDTLLLKVRADEAARVERGRVLQELAELNKEQLEELQETLDENPNFYNQPLPPALRERLRQ